MVPSTSSSSPVPGPSGAGTSRRAVLRGGLAAGAVLLGGSAAARAQSLGSDSLGGGSLGGGSLGSAGGSLLRDRPTLTHGVAAGDVRRDGALIWARADRPATLVVETAPTADFRGARRWKGPVLSPSSDGTGRLRLVGLEAGQDVHYRVTVADAETGATSEPRTGVFRTAPAEKGPIRLQWSGDVCGQGWGINPDLGGMRIWRTMADRNPDLFLHSGDTVYADGPLEETVALPGGETWRNIMTPEKSKVAETLAEYRGQFAYNLLDEHYRHFNSRVVQAVQWDDHEVTNNWYAGEILDGEVGEKYTEKRVDVLAARAFQAFHEWMPIDPTMAVDGRIHRRIAYGPQLDVFVLDMRTYKDANTLGSRGDTGRVLGEEQLRWLIDGVTRSTATWKVIAADLPIGLVVPDGDHIEGIGQGDDGAPQGRETEIARALAAFKAAGVRNHVWLTADVHYTAAHHYSPERAGFTDFDEFWEFVSGPLNAGAFGPNELEGTFGPRAEFVHAPGPDAANTPPSDPSFQHFGEVRIDADGRFTVDLLDGRGTSLWSRTLEPHWR